MNTIRRCCIILVLGAGATYAVPSDPSMPSGLVNGSFRQGLSGWTATGPDTVTVDTVEGRTALRVRLTAPAWAGATQRVSVPPGSRRALVQGWLRSTAVRGGGQGWERGRLQVEFRDAQGDTTGGWQLAVGQVRGRMPWHRVKRTYQIPPGATSLTVGCMLGNSTGTLHCADIAVGFLP